MRPRILPILVGCLLAWEAPASPALGAEEAEGLVKRLLAEEDPKPAMNALVALGFEAVGPLFEAGCRERDADRRKRIEDALEKLEGAESALDAPVKLEDPVTRESVMIGKPDRLVSPAVSDDGRRICLAFKPKGDSKPPKVIVLDREAGKVLAVINGQEPRLSSSGLVVVYLRPLGDPIRFYETFYTSTASVFLPKTRGAFDLDPDPRDNHFNLTLSANGRRASFQARLTCVVREVKEGGPPLFECDGKLPALSPDGRWLAHLDGGGRVDFREIGGAKTRKSFGPLSEGLEIREIRPTSRGLGVVFLAGPRGKPKGAFLWGFRSETGALGVLAPTRGCTGLTVSEDGRILYCSSGVFLKRGFKGKPERLASRADCAGLSPSGCFAVTVKGRTITTVFLGIR